MCEVDGINKPWGIHWFRRDLRVFGNSALRENWARTEGRVLGIFFFDSSFLSRKDFSHNRFAFFLKTLTALREELALHGGDLLVADALPKKGFDQLFHYCKDKNISLPSCVSWSRDYEPFSRTRDQGIEVLLKEFGVDQYQSRDHLLFEPHEITKDAGSLDPYQVYSPYAKKWLERMSGKNGEERIQAFHKFEGYLQSVKSKNLKPSFSLSWNRFTSLGAFPFQDQLQSFWESNQPHVDIEIPEAGLVAGCNQVLQFKNKVSDYNEKRDFPALPGTSKLSIFLKNGSIVPALVIKLLDLNSFARERSNPKELWKIKSGSMQFIKEIAWREFYYSILFFRPEVETRSFLPAYANLKWQNSTEHFQRWCEGSTGFPIVDAGMRQLNKTGWMHNRVRMIVASFLVKDLLIDWRWGENYFMLKLLDGDLAPNNGGWQWAASTGCDPQPYFRIFNPWLQSEKFDSEGVYIKTYVPELAHAPAESLHAPDFDRSKWNYPDPMVDHRAQKEKALSLFKSVTKAGTNKN